MNAENRLVSDGSWIWWLSLLDDMTCGSQIDRVAGWQDEGPKEAAIHQAFVDAVRQISRICVTCHLLADDPSIITPDVLSKDRDRYESETDEAWKQRAVDRARRRGIVGWNIGADYEVCPHYRRPHFGLRHTGKGKTVPRIVPIKGAVVHRSRLTEVPTGYMLPDGTEIEHGKILEKNNA
jgi:hypothetical protein